MPFAPSAVPPCEQRAVFTQAGESDMTTVCERALRDVVDELGPLTLLMAVRGV